MASSSNWIILITFGVLLMVCVSKTDDSAAESKDTNTDDDENTIKIYKRLIPADVLRGKSPYYVVYYQMFSSYSNVRIRIDLRTRMNWFSCFRPSLESKSCISFNNNWIVGKSPQMFSTLLCLAEHAVHAGAGVSVWSSVLNFKCDRSSDIRYVRNTKYSDRWCDVYLISRLTNLSVWFTERAMCWDSIEIFPFHIQRMPFNSSTHLYARSSTGYRSTSCNFVF